MIVYYPSDSQDIGITLTAGNGNHFSSRYNITDSTDIEILRKGILMMRLSTQTEAAGSH